MYADERIISKVKKVLELSKNNPSEVEAKAAALKAQAMMAQYHISLADIEDINDIEEIFEVHVNVGKGNKWKYLLSGIISKNFMCKRYYIGKSIVVFYGYKTDAEIASETFKFLFEFGNKSANRFYQNEKNRAERNGEWFDGKGLKNAYLIGFLEGIAEVLEKQCTALMLVTPQAVEDAYKKKTQGMRTTNHNLSGSGSREGCKAREEGRITGRSAVQQRSIECA